MDAISDAKVGFTQIKLMDQMVSGALIILPTSSVFRMEAMGSYAMHAVQHDQAP